MKSMTEYILIIGNKTTFVIWLFFAVGLVYQIRLHLSGIMYGSFSKHTKTCRKKANAAAKEQTIWRRITMTYIGDYVSDKLRKPYKMYMVFKVVFDIWIILGGMLTVSMKFAEIPYAPMIQGINILGLTVFNIVMMVLYNPVTRETRFIDFMY